MKIFLSLFFLLFSLEAFSSGSIVDAEKFRSFLESLKQDPSPAINRYDHLRKEKTIGFISKGPILHGNGTKYGLEYMLEASGPYDLETKEFTIEKVEISYMEMTYCDFQYTNDEDYRFRRLTLTLDEKANFQNLLEYKLLYAPEDNDGTCMGMSAPQAESDPRHPFNKKMRALFKTVIGQWIGDRLIE